MAMVRVLDWLVGAEDRAAVDWDATYAEELPRVGERLRQVDAHRVTLRSQFLDPREHPAPLRVHHRSALGLRGTHPLA